ncbi:hypothetical protein [Chryseobacterium sp. c4a]|uniref:hypothetical protein n=1 Tax=Chryseobacterium sp. c4a TaxID=1573582 RepID=UPI00135CA78D|nr:hypothetical protein [Chryseobacterium sp. c4a]
MKFFDKELTIPDINKNSEKLSSGELKTIENKNKIEVERTKIKRKEIQSLQNHDVLPDTVYIKSTALNADNNVTEYFFNNQTKDFGINTYFDSDPLLQDQALRDSYINAQPMKFLLSKTYYSNGNLKTKRLTFSSVIIKNYEYDEKGLLIKEDDLAKSSKLSVSDILKILEKNGIEINFKINRLSASANTYLYCINTDKGKIWYLQQYENNQESIIFDETGKIINQVRYSKDPGSFVVLSVPAYRNIYKDKSIEEAEKETGLRIFLMKE